MIEASFRTLSQLGIWARAGNVKPHGAVFAVPLFLLLPVLHALSSKQQTGSPGQLGGRG